MFKSAWVIMWEQNIFCILQCANCHANISAAQPIGLTMCRYWVRDVLCASTRFPVHMCKMSQMCLQVRKHCAEVCASVQKCENGVLPQGLICTCVQKCASNVLACVQKCAATGLKCDYDKESANVSS